jgi:hypothetical protein
MAYTVYEFMGVTRRKIADVANMAEAFNAILLDTPKATIVHVTPDTENDAADCLTSDGGHYTIEPVR